MRLRLLVAQLGEDLLQGGLVFEVHLGFHGDAFRLVHDEYERLGVVHEVAREVVRVIGPNLSALFLYVVDLVGYELRIDNEVHLLALPGGIPYAGALHALDLAVVIAGQLVGAVLAVANQFLHLLGHRVGVGLVHRIIWAVEVAGLRGLLGGGRGLGGGGFRAGFGGVLAGLFRRARLFGARRGAGGIRALFVIFTQEEVAANDQADYDNCGDDNADDFATVAAATVASGVTWLAVRAIGLRIKRVLPRLAITLLTETLLAITLLALLAKALRAVAWLVLLTVTRLTLLTVARLALVLAARELLVAVALLAKGILRLIRILSRVVLRTVTGSGVTASLIISHKNSLR